MITWLLKVYMFSKCISAILLLMMLGVSARTENEDTLYIRCGHVYRGEGQWSAPGEMWAVTSGKTFPVLSFEKKSGYLDMSRFWMVPALENFWIPRVLDSSYSCYPYVQTGLPQWQLREIYQSMLKKGIISFVLYPDGPDIRSGDVLELVYPGTFSLKGLMIFQESVPESLYRPRVNAMEHSCSARERERLYQWKNNVFPLFTMTEDSTGQRYLLEIDYHEYDTDTSVTPMIRVLQEVELLQEYDSLQVTYKDPDHVFKTLHQLEAAAGIRILDHITSSPSGDSYSPHILFLNGNPLIKPAHVKFMMINGKFSVNK
ncbi:hypothetical protein FMIA91_02800 [Fidelibacter multiformis]